MALAANRRPVMTLFSDAQCPLSHRTRIAVAEKNINVNVVTVSRGCLPEDLIDLNPYNTVPTLVDRDLALYDSRIIMEYLDERYPHPPLMPVDPVSRARSRLMLYCIDRDWYSLLDDIESTDGSRLVAARKMLRDALTVIAPVFEQKPFFMSDAFTLVDCAVAAVLWRLPAWGIELPPQARSVTEYGERLFDRAGFRASLTREEKDLRD
ncbi:MAG: glutathione S-transferase [Gammaproteobacteria bacterium]|nr:MAG: glutathione S-transferase [Gammaproteobacteria bacterium]TND02704.1 MAG: glutathione S-transferase [Gammaproteobacteria bacterium]